MKRKEVIAALGLSVISTLSACGSNEIVAESVGAAESTVETVDSISDEETEQSDLLKMINDGDMIEIEIAVPSNVVAADEDMLAWIILASLTSQETMREQWDDTLKITMTSDGKNGCIYVDVDGKNENNNTLRVALHNRAFVTMLEDPDIIASLAEAADKAYTDVDSLESQDKAFYMALNGYFNLLPDAKDGASNADDALSRKEFMAMIARAELPVDDSLRASESFNTAVGSSEFNAFAEQEAPYSYLDLESKSLNNKTYNGTMSRGEAAYLIVNHFFQDDLKKVGNLSAKFTDCKDGGNIAEQQKFIEKGNKKDYYRDYELVYALQNPDDGCPSAIYNALLVANSKGLITNDTRWDEGITKYEAMKLITEALKQETGIPTFNYSNGSSQGAGATKVQNNTDKSKSTASNKSKDSKEEVADNMGNAGQVDLSDGLTEEEFINQIAEEAESEVTTKDYTIEKMDDTTMYATQTCNLREGPSTDYKRVGQLQTNEEVIVNGKVQSPTGKSWYVLKTEDNSTKMVSSSLLSTSKVSTSQAKSGSSSSGNNSGNSSSGNSSSGNSSSGNTAAQPAQQQAPSDCMAVSSDCEGYCSIEGVTNLGVASHCSGDYCPQAE